MVNLVELVPQNSTTRAVRNLARKERKQLLTAFWLGACTFFILEGLTIEDADFLSILGAIIIAIAALIPSYLWVSSKALGLPIFPLFALTYLWTHAIQLVSNNTRVAAYSPESQFFASLTVAGFLGLTTLVWFLFVRTAPKPPKFYRAFSSNKGGQIFWGILIANILFDMGAVGGWWFFLGNFFTLYRAVIIGLNSLAVFVLAYRWGRGDFSRVKSIIFVILITVACVASATSFLLIGAMAIFLMATIAFIAGKGKVPWVTIIIVALCFSLLHLGKASMREKYWTKYGQTFVQPWEYPAVYAEWIDRSFQEKNNSDLLYAEGKKNKKQSALERSSLIQLLLLVQEKSPRDIPYLNGATYAIIPELLVPRFLNPNKITSQESIAVLSIQYGLQTRIDTTQTAIGWGLLNEAYANFGLGGCAVLAVVLGAGYGQATRWSIQTPLLAARSLLGIIIVGYAFQSEFTASVYVTALWQSTTVLYIVNLIFMKREKNRQLTG